MRGFVYTGLLLITAVGLLSCTSRPAPDKGQAAPPVSEANEAATSPTQDTQKETSGSHKDFVVYYDKKSPDNHYIPSGWMGDYSDIQMDEACFDNPQSGTTCLKFTYTAKGSLGKGWAGVYWQNPANNWGDSEAGYNLSGLNKLTFWARGEKGGETITAFKVGGIAGKFKDSLDVEIGPITLTNTWQEYSLNLVGKDLSHIIGGFCWVADRQSNPWGATFYLDNIRYVYDPGLKPLARIPEKMPFYIYQDEGSSVNHFIPSGWMGDFGDIQLESGCKENPHSGNACIKITYSAKGSQGARWAGVYWQYPANNWGNIDRSYDLSSATKLTFWARGEKGDEVIQEFKVGGIIGEFADSDSSSIGPIKLTPDWRQYTIDLAGKDLSSIFGGFCWSTNADVNPQGATFYLDEIRFE
jgi:hypothetical protein